MVYPAPARHAASRHFEVDSTESVWYSDGNPCGDSAHDFEVDSTESVWYKSGVRACGMGLILKLTPQSQYGIRTWPMR